MSRQALRRLDADTETAIRRIHLGMLLVTVVVWALAGLAIFVLAGVPG